MKWVRAFGEREERFGVDDRIQSERIVLSKAHMSEKELIKRNTVFQIPYRDSVLTIPIQNHNGMQNLPYGTFFAKMIATSDFSSPYRQNVPKRQMYRSPIFLEKYYTLFLPKSRGKPTFSGTARIGQKHAGECIVSERSEPTFL